MTKSIEIDDAKYNTQKRTIVDAINAMAQRICAGQKTRHEDNASPTIQLLSQSYVSLIEDSKVFTKVKEIPFDHRRTRVFMLLRNKDAKLR